MTFTRQQIQTAYKKLSKKDQSFVISSETTEFIALKLKEINLSLEKETAADGEIFNSLLGLQTLDTAMQKISEISGKGVNDLSKLKSTLRAVF